MSLPVGVRTEYLLDAGRSHAIYTALRPVLSEVRRMLGGSLGLVGYRPRTPGSDLLVLAVDAPGMADPPLPNESFQLGSLPSRHQPSVLADLLLSSSLRPRQLLLRSALVVPWADEHGAGMVIVGQTRTTPALPQTTADVVRRMSANVRKTVSTGRRQGAVEINRDLQRAMKEVAAGAVDCADVGGALTTLLRSVQRLFNSDVAYLSLPEHDVDTFTFDQVLGIHTPDFRHLRIREGQGLGGLARSERHTVRSLNYARDSRLQAAPVAETAREGIVSAMATPIVVDEQVQAVLYVGDRKLRPYSETDEDVLGEFAGYATLGLKRRATDAYRRDVLRRQEQERLAYDLHDTAVRGLLEIGFAAERGHEEHGADPDVRANLASIAAAAERCMDALRGQLDTLIGSSSERTADQVVEEIAEASLRPDAGHRFTTNRPDSTLPSAVAEALIRIGQEALVNVDLHAERPAEISLETTAERWVLSIADAGPGPRSTSGHSEERAARSHLGVRAMQRAAEQVSGQVERLSPPDVEGYVVRATVPTRNNS
ncbi:GAF domain-containing protein [Saccharopolyspora sp. 6V]|uniref:GAF domain-containing sensor histidine kinase n=2 Tax=unclassified Saccharopolyspora TaxID=2646250 RepID=UPI001CD44A1D|nr:GAF domain-containing protein [Saccharopolyspora sp. 6V]MCA1194599.1 GAF domain-containing protein [Saccharopolyspora sp. 6V]